jgi:hypothetical protein
MVLTTRLTAPPSGQDALEVRERYLRKRRSRSFDRRWRIAAWVVLSGVACWICVAGFTVFVLGS